MDPGASIGAGTGRRAATRERGMPRPCLAARPPGKGAGLADAPGWTPGGDRGARAADPGGASGAGALRAPSATDMRARP